MSQQASRQFNGSSHQKTYHGHNGGRPYPKPSHPTYVQSGIPAGYQSGIQPGLPNGGAIPVIPQHDPNYVTQYEASYAEQCNPPRQNYVYLQSAGQGGIPTAQQVPGTQYVISTPGQSIPHGHQAASIPPPCYGPQPTSSQAAPNVQTMAAPVQPSSVPNGVPSSNQKKPYNSDPNKYKGVPLNLMYGLHKNCSKKVHEAAALANNNGESTYGILFYRSDANRGSTGPNDKWKAPFLGKAIELNPSQIEFITKFLNLTEDPFNYGMVKSTPSIPSSNVPYQPPVNPQGATTGASQTGNMNGAMNGTAVASQTGNMNGATVAAQLPPSMQQISQPTVTRPTPAQPSAGQPGGAQLPNGMVPKKVTIAQQVIPPGCNQPPGTVVYTYAQVPNLLDI